MQSNDFQVKRRHLPHWTFTGAVYFVTFKLKKGQLSVQEQKLVLEHVRGGDKKYYELIAAVVMPDHVHILLKPNEGQILSGIMKGIKGVAARKINAARGACGPVWQGESFDRIVRNEKEFNVKLRYMFYNPLKKGLTLDPWSYHGWYAAGK